MLLNLTDLSSETLQDQISRQIIEKVLNNELNPGDELSPIGLIARRQHVSKNTVKKAYNYLESNGAIEFKNNLGFFIKKLSPEKKESLLKNLISSNHTIDIKNTNLANETLQIRKLEEDLKVARQIQSDLLPRNPIMEKDISIAGFIEPSRVVSGDFYDHFFIDKNKIGLVIADASGKGMPAAILISQIQAILKSEISNGCGIISVMKKLNNHLIQNCSAKNFTTLFYGIYNIKEEIFEYANAGHNLPILVSERGNFELLKTTGPALGLIGDFKYSIQNIRINPGDALLLYTDGIIETMNNNGEQFGEGMLIKLLLNYFEKDTNTIIQTIINELNKFKSESYVQDDKTLMLFNRIVLEKRN